MNDFTHNRTQEARRITTAAALLCALALLGVLVPGVEQTINLAVTGLAALALTTLVVRLLARRVREHREDRADALAAARWRAVHAPHLLTTEQHDLLGTRTVPAARVAGVA